MIDLSKVNYKYLIAELQRRVSKSGGGDITMYYISDVIEWIEEYEDLIGRNKS